MAGEPYVSRGGEKLAAALDCFGLDPSGATCADLGSHVGGFVDCLLRRGTARVFAIDTCYGTLAWKLRKDDRVVVLERTNAMHVELPEPVDLVTIDVGWTPQAKLLPHVARLLSPHGRVITLIKPHYEAPKDQLVDGVLPDEHWEAVVDRVISLIKGMGWQINATCDSPILGHAGNRELFALLTAKRKKGHSTFFAAQSHVSI
jgi:23S rRNA (cytidine1920-2'-O)/16S rRNA (cytidine1409-2'-O)-methyltransferase